MAVDLTVYGPATYIRESGTPVVETAEFDVANASVSYQLTVINGGLQDDPALVEYVSASEILVNGVEVVSESNFNQNLQTLTVPVTLQSHNTLSVELRGKPGGSIALIIERVSNQLPLAQAGLDQTVFVGDTVQLDGSDSTDADGDPLTYIWSLDLIPSGSGALLSDITSAMPTFDVDQPGSYQLSLIVNDGFEDSLSDTVLIDTANSAPVADAGSDQTPFVGSTVLLDGSASYDVDNDPLTYHWILIEQPVDSVTVLEDINAAIASLTIDQPGHYQAQLIVNDSQLDSAPDIVDIDTQNSAPVADPGPDQTVFVGETVILDGNGSHDVDNDSLTYRWSLLSQPTGSMAALASTDQVQSSFVPDQEGLYIIQLVVNDSQLDSSPVTTNITVQVQPINHDPVITSDPVLTGTVGETYAYAVVAEDIDGNPLSYQLTAFPAGMSIDGQGLIAWTPESVGDVAVVVLVDDGLGGVASQSFTVNVQDLSNPSLPPDPAMLAPPLNPSQFTSIGEATAFLYSGEHPIQTGVSPGTILEKRATVIRGQVIGRDNAPLSGVTVSIKDHSEFGQTLSRADGAFDLVVNGGSLLTLSYRKPQYLPAQRQVDVPWQDFVMAPDVVLVQQDSQLNTIDLTDNSQAIQAAQGSPISDADGTRQLTLMIPRGTQAEVYNADGTTHPVTTLNLRLTEYTVGDNGPRAMPAPLPPQSAYTYAFEAKAEETDLKIDGRDVLFDRPVSFYVDNFLNFPVGMAVPAGYYNADKGAWIPAPNGRVVEIVAINQGRADLDTDGDHVIDDANQLATLGISDDERAKLAELYPVGKSLWRVQTTHLSTWDYNWPYVPPEDATEPKQPKPETLDKEKPDDPCEAAGSVIECETQILKETLPITGTGLTLNYSSDRVPGRKTGRVVHIPLSGASVPASLKRIDLVIDVAGRTFEYSFPNQPNQNYTFEWDGIDAYGRSANVSTAHIKIGYIYDPFYADPVEFDYAFARFSQSAISRNSARTEITIWQEQKLTLGMIQKGLGAWSISQHHFYDPIGKTLYLGNGSKRGDNLAFGNIIESIAGTGSMSYGGDGGPAAEAQFNEPHSVVMGPNGDVYISDWDNHCIRRIDGQGIITAYAGICGQHSFSPGQDNVLATSIRLYYPDGLAFAPDGTLIFAESGNHRIRRIDKNGIITTVAGTTGGSLSYNIPALEAALGWVEKLAVTPDGSIIFTTNINSTYFVHRIDPSGILVHFAGTGTQGFAGDGGPATNARLNFPSDLTVMSDGSVLIADTSNHRIRKVTPDGLISTIAGTGQKGFTGDGGLATQAKLNNPTGIAVLSDGSIVFKDNYNYRIRKIDSQGIISTYAGTGQNGYGGDNGLALQARLGAGADFALGSHDSLFVADYYGNSRVRLIKPALPGFDGQEMGVFSENGMELYVFNTNGRHVQTVNTLTNAIIFSFAYNRGCCQFT